MKRMSTVLFVIVLLAAWTMQVLAAPATATFPTFSIVSVDPGKSVTVQTHNFSADDTYVVRMGNMGTRGVKGIKVDTIDSGDGGSFKLTFKIPSTLEDNYQIAIRMESPDSGFFAYNWFYNATSGGSGTGGQPAPTYGLPAGVFPTFSITSVDADESVTIQTKNLSKNDTYTVTMGKMGTRGVGGVRVETIDTGTGGSKEYTFDIPKSLKGMRQIAIRIQSSKSGYFAYNWFYNNTTSSGDGGTGGIPETPDFALPPGVFPTFSITGVARDKTVTIRTKNLSPNDTYTVLMGAMGTRGVGGVKVDTVDTDDGGTQTLTFKIPSSLAGSSQIAIRLQSSKSGYFAFNWFYNNTTP